MNIPTFSAAKSHIGALTFSHGGNGDPLAVKHNDTFYDNLFDLSRICACNPIGLQFHTLSPLRGI